MIPEARVAQSNENTCSDYSAEEKQRAQLEVHKDNGDISCTIWSQNTDVNSRIEPLSPTEHPDKPDSRDGKIEKSEQELAGVEKAKKLRELWTLKSLCVAYASVFLLCFVLNFQMQVYNSLYAYAVSAFQAHSLVSTITTVANIVNAVMKPPLARLCDVFGRLEAFSVSVVCFVVGLVLVATCKNVQTYAGGVVLYNVGYTGLEFIITVFLSDTSSLAARPLMLGTSMLPSLVNIWIGPLVGQAFYRHSTWRWGIGVWGAIVPVCALPFFIVFYVYQRKASQLGLVKPQAKTKIGRFLQQFDFIGIFFMSAGFCLLLITLTIAGYDGNKWKQPLYIIMLILGVVFLILFVFYEMKLAKFPAIPFHLMREPTVSACCVIVFLVYFTYYCWDNYLTSFLQVVHYTTINSAGHISNIFYFCSALSGLFVGILVRIYKRPKLFLFLAIPITILGQVLMIRYRGTQYNWGYQVMPQIFVSVADGVITTLMFVCIQSVGKQENFAMLTALLYTVISVGSAVGSSVSGTIWINTMPSRLNKYLPDDYKNQSTTIFESLVTQLSFPRGSNVRNAIIHAYEDVQRILTIVSTAFSATLYIPLWFVANPKLSTKNVSLFEDEKEKKGQIV
ncbi:siderophore iron transporter 1 [Schizosaccharomyces japonicus yFS275]|uniref:Siderophore iron transporter 1 n=1 Tax=Schizosaccharomyces japonicus (strain yFS275 / FY16936) TaxID=402676 RepID=B6K116_SCHJY|nr:siderophore iron transporter 1 [Schizosaccharomyces japonicus yFS275]EEB07637.1 siderophore iron transporter 1 [Schizosaccharomyces japonicus yFS275]